MGHTHSSWSPWLLGVNQWSVFDGEGSCSVREEIIFRNKLSTFNLYLPGPGAKEPQIITVAFWHEKCHTAGERESER